MAPDTEQRKPRITVAGAGVLGLSCAVRVAEAGYPVDVLARDLPLETTSALAGGHWGPYLAEPAGDVERWARRTFAELESISAAARSGVSMRTGYFVGSHRPAWAERLADVMPLTRVTGEAPGGRGGWRAHVPMANMPVYLGYLVDRLRTADGTITRLPLSALPSRGVVINCTGLAARSLANDADMHPVRGQVVTLSNPGLTNWLIDTDAEAARPTYIFPHAGRVVVGGTAEPEEWSAEPDDASIQQILGRATALVPELAGARVLSRRSGLRPVRSAVRVETVITAHSTIVHCYGHGGSGVTLSWGCADEVLGEVEAAFRVGHSA